MEFADRRLRFRPAQYGSAGNGEQTNVSSRSRSFPLSQLPALAASRSRRSGRGSNESPKSFAVRTVRMGGGESIDERTRSWLIPRHPQRLDA